MPTPLRRRAHAPGAADVPTKPVDFDGLGITIHKTLEDIAKLRGPRTAASSPNRVRSGAVRLWVRK